MNRDALNNFWYSVLLPLLRRPFIPEMLLKVPSLEVIRDALYDGLRMYFNELEVEVVPCPPLTSPPYNLAANGLCGDSAIATVGDEHALIPDLRRKLYCNVPLNLLEYYQNVFFIGGGYAAKPHSPYNGHFSTNAYGSRSYRYYLRVNNSCITYEEATTGQKILQTIGHHGTCRDMVCPMLGNFFVSEGRPGMVIKVRAKGRKINFDILTLIQGCLAYYFPKIEIGLGGVLHINGGRVIQFVTPENYPESFSDNTEFFRWLRIHEVNCNNLITVGALFNKPSFVGVGQYGDTGSAVTGSRYKFYSTVNSEVIGQFVNDVTPSETEYIGYFNVAQDVYSFNEDW